MSKSTYLPALTNLHKSFRDEDRSCESRSMKNILVIFRLKIMFSLIYFIVMIYVRLQSFPLSVN